MPTLQLPPISILDAAAARLFERDGDALVNKAIYALGKGVEIVTTCGGFLIPSSDGSTVYRVDNVRGCSCKAGMKHGRCYHHAMLHIIEEAQRHTMPALAPLGERLAKARREMAELF